MPGTLMLRRLMGHQATGARVCHGESLFATWSPNEQHSSIVLRLMRTREADPVLGEDLHSSVEARDVLGALRTLSKEDEPRIANISTAAGQKLGMEEATSVHLPLYGVRKKVGCPRSASSCGRFHV